MAGLFEALNNELLPYALLAIAVAILLHVFLGQSATPEPKPEKEEEEEEEPDPQRAFTIAQLRKFNGVVTESTPKFDLDAGKIYIGVKGDVYDVTKGAQFYGPEGPYHVFAGRDASRALARLSFDEETLANPRIDDLSFSELDQLNDWIGKFEMKRYPIVGKLVTPPSPKEFTLEELSKYNGTGEILPGRVDPLLYIGCKGKVYDVTFGGFEMYKPGAGYFRFAGKDVSRALAKMSFEPEDIDSRVLSDLTPEQNKVLDDWDDKFANKKLYPVVGTLPAYE